ncbi:glucosaminidase domain-containing protein [Flavobacterium sp. '19STA2R22 D10 B1']|uniref:glucosaminidase domain-containing protein n=1 Tax=Flavobacterium aerium TaxID=3037261 RepID=UPI00278C72E7|nr:glucosaminidase domain-containing protein [Flavobacterium sp. '19STA2R22 D10 B1']
MYKKISLLIIIALFASCKSTKSTVKNSRNSKSKTEITRNTKRPIVTKNNSTANKNSNSGSNSTSETLESTSRTTVTSDLVLGYISSYKGVAQSNMKEYGIPASIILAQGILESGAGNGTLSRKANNHFGIKCHKEWTGDSVKHDDDALQECFRKYTDPSESYKDHALFLTTRSRYSKLFTLPKGDYQAWAKGLKNAGYATDPKYPDKLIGLIERYNLHQYDTEVLGGNFVPTSKPVETRPVVTTTTTTPEVSDPNATYRVEKGETLYSISKKFGITVDELRSKNNISDNAISIGQVLKIK